MARHSSSMLQGVADSNARRATSNLQIRYEAIVRHYRHRLERFRAANREMEISIILHDLIVDRRRRVEDLPRDVLDDVEALVAKNVKLVKDRLSKMEAARETPAPVPEIVLVAAPPATKDLGGDAAGEPRL